MTYHGHVKQGLIVLDESVQLPEGAEVEVLTGDRVATGPAWDDGEDQDNGALVSGSVAAAGVVLGQEDFSDWER